MCKNFKLLYQSSCVAEAQCPTGTWNHQERYDRRCIDATTITTTPSPATTTATTTATPLASTTTTTRPLMCGGGFTNELVPAPCTCSQDCQRCLYVGYVTGACLMCKNYKLLYGFACINETQCPTGTWNHVQQFNRRCIDPTTIATGATSSSSAVTTTLAPTVTASVSSSVATTASAAPLVCGAGKTNEPTPVVCFCSLNCQRCDYTGYLPGACIMCKNYQLLLDGACVSEAACPTGTWNHQERFGRRCINATTTPSVATVASTASSTTETTTATTTTTTTVATTAAGTTSATATTTAVPLICGGGHTNDPVPLNCTCGADSNCQRCLYPDHVAGACLMCKNYRLLYQGVCVTEAQCPTGTWNHQERYDRRCIETTTTVPTPTVSTSAAAP